MISNLVKIELLKNRKRWDFSFYDPDYEHVLELIRNSRFEHLKLADLLESASYGINISNENTTDGIPFIRIQNIREYGIDPSDICYVSENTQNLDKYKLRLGDVLVIRSGSNIGNSVAVPENLEGSVYGSYTIKLRPLKEKVSSEFLAIVLNSFLLKTQILASKGRATQPSISIVELEALEIPLPPLSIQNQVARRMQEAFTEAEHLRIEAERLVTEAKAQVERMILGEEDAT